MEKEQKTLEVLKLYLKEWEIRNEDFNKQSYRLFGIATIVSLVPYVEFKANILSEKFPVEVFHFAGMFIAIFSLVISLYLQRRVSSVYRKYNDLLFSLDKGYGHYELSPYKAPNALFKFPVSKILPLFIALSLVAFNIFCLVKYPL